MDLCIDMIVFSSAFFLASVLSSLGGVKTYDLYTFSPEGSTHIWDAAGKVPAKPCRGYPVNGELAVRPKVGREEWKDAKSSQRET